MADAATKPSALERPRAPTLRARSGVPLRRCAAGSAIEILQEKWVLHIVHALLDGTKGFNELGREVGGCNPTTLTQRLARLEALGVVEKEPQTDSQPRCGYRLTRAGRDLERVIVAIRSWAVAHLPAEELAAQERSELVEGPRQG